MARLKLYTHSPVERTFCLVAQCTAHWLRTVQTSKCGHTTFGSSGVMMRRYMFVLRMSSHLAFSLSLMFRPSSSAPPAPSLLSPHGPPDFSAVSDIFSGFSGPKIAGPAHSPTRVRTSLATWPRTSLPAPFHSTHEAWPSSLTHTEEMTTLFFFFCASADHVCVSLCVTAASVMNGVASDRGGALGVRKRRRKRRLRCHWNHECSSMRMAAAAVANVSLLLESQCRQTLLLPFTLRQLQSLSMWRRIQWLDTRCLLQLLPYTLHQRL